MPRNTVIKRAKTESDVLKDSDIAISFIQQVFVSVTK